MKRLIKILKAQGVWGQVAKKDIIYDISEVLSELPLTADSKQIERYVDKCDKNKQ